MNPFFGTCLCFLFFLSSLFLASFLAWSVGFMNFPPLVVLVDRFPILEGKRGGSGNTQVSYVTMSMEIYP